MPFIPSYYTTYATTAVVTPVVYAAATVVAPVVYAAAPVVEYRPAVYQYTPRTEVRTWNEVVPRTEVRTWNEIVPRTEVRHYNEVTAVQPAVTVVRNRVIY